MACLKRKLVESESGLNVLQDKYQLLEKENETLLEKVKLLEKEASEKENSVVSAQEKLVTIESLKDVKDTLAHEKSELEVTIFFFFFSPTIIA